MSVAVALCAIGSFLFSIASSMVLAVVARWMIGAGSAFAFVGVLKLGVTWLPQRFFAMFVGFTTALAMLGGLFGEVILSRLELVYHWSSMMRYSAYIGFILLPFFIVFVREPNSVTDLAVQRVGFSALLRSLWLVVRHPGIWLVGFTAAMLFSSLSVFAAVSGIPLLQARFAQSLVWSAHLISAVFAGWLIGAPLLGWLADYFSLRRFILIAGSFSVIICFAIFLYAPLHAAWLIWLLLFLYGFASSSEVLAFALVREWVDDNISATALALVNFVIMLGAMLLQPMISAYLQFSSAGHMRSGMQVYSWHDYRRAMTILLLMLCLGFVSSVFLRKPQQLLDA